MRRINITNIIVLLTAVLLCATSCGLRYIPSDDKAAFEQLLPDLFSALDSSDQYAIYNLFSPATRAQNDNLQEDISCLISLYGGPTDEFNLEGVGMSTLEHFGPDGTQKSSNVMFPVRSGDKYYWFYIAITYEHAVKDQLGITQLEFFTADERCDFSEDDSKRIIERPGLYLHTDKVLDCELRAIDGEAHRYISNGQTIDLSDVKNFFKKSTSFSDFTDRFGQPNAKRNYSYYELPDENGEPRYLCIGEADGLIFVASVVDDFKFIKRVYKQQ